MDIHAALAVFFLSSMLLAGAASAANAGTGATIMVRLPGDANYDCIVDIFDMSAVGISFGSVPGDSNWNPDADLNHDGIIDIFDMAKVGINYYNECG
jgi:hypothetical protein